MCGRHIVHVMGAAASNGIAFVSLAVMKREQMEIGRIYFSFFFVLVGMHPEWSALSERQESPAHGPQQVLRRPERVDNSS